MNSNVAASMMLLSVLVIPALPESIGPTAPESTEEEMVRSLPITMSEAVEAAEAVIPGQAVEAQLALAESRPVYEVHMIGIDQSQHTVQVGAEDGQVVVIDDNELTDEDEMVQAGQGGSI